MSNTSDAAEDIGSLDRAVSRANLAAVIDVSGRGGNLFFLTLFDQHPDVICSPIVQYTYSYIWAAFGDAAEVDAAAAHRFITQTSYFRLIYNDPEGENLKLLTRMGADANAPLDRQKLRQLVDAFFATRQTLSRRDIVLAPLLAYAMARGQDVERVKYALVGDAISLREEHVNEGFSGRIVDLMFRDFPDAKLFHLVRDPRATFASPRHQFVNSLGNMYAIAPGQYLSRLWTLLKADLKPDNGCVYLYWLLYLRQTERTIRALHVRYRGRLLTVRNEDLNTNFPPTTKRIAEWLGVEYIAEWHTSDFVPTIHRVPWAGIGAYNSRYQRAVTGLLANDSDEVASRVTGPNEYVTRRWRTRLSAREIELIEHLFRPDLETYGYEILHDVAGRSDTAALMRTALLPFEGEIPTLGWLNKGRSAGWSEFLRRLFYTVSFPPFYVVSRLQLFDYVLRRKFFALIDGGKSARTH